MSDLSKIIIDSNQLEKLGLVPKKLNVGNKDNPQYSADWHDEIKSVDGKFYILPRNIENGVYFNTLVMIPNELNENTRIAMTTRNTCTPSRAKLGGKDLDKNIEQLTDEEMDKFLPSSTGALEEICSQEINANEIFVYPMILNRRGGPNHQQLTRGSLEDRENGFERIDLQIIKAIDSIRTILQEQGINIPKEIDLIGQSAAGSFAQRFCLLHLDRINVCCTNGAKDAMILPVSEYKTRHEVLNLNYPNGIADIDFDFEKARQIPMLMTYGVLEDLDAHVNSKGELGTQYDKVHLSGSTITTNEEAELWKKTMGSTQGERMLNTLKNYRSVGLNLTSLAFLEYGHGQGQGSFEATQRMLEIANSSSSPEEKINQQADMVTELKSKYKVIDLRDVIEQQREESFINASKKVEAVR